MEEVYKIETLSFKFAYPRLLFYDYLQKLFFVLEDKGKIIGYVMADDERNLIVSIAIHPDYRRKGYGKMLMEHVLKFMKGRIILQVRKSNEIAINFYKKLGFKEVGKIRKYYIDGEDAILMAKRID